MQCLVKTGQLDRLFERNTYFITKDINILNQLNELA